MTELLRINGHRIVIDYIYPPIPPRCYDYQASAEDYEPGDPLGYGATALAALADLREQLESLEDAPW